jgi:hypothetical protein
MQWLFEGPISGNITVKRAVDYAIAITIIVSEICKKKKGTSFLVPQSDHFLSESREKLVSEMRLYSAVFITGFVRHKMQPKGK